MPRKQRINGCAATKLSITIALLCFTFENLPAIHRRPRSSKDNLAINGPTFSTTRNQLRVLAPQNRRRLKYKNKNHKANWKIYAVYSTLKLYAFTHFQVFLAIFWQFLLELIKKKKIKCVVFITAHGNKTFFLEYTVCREIAPKV